MNRSLRIDCVKGIAIWLVTTGHFLTANATRTIVDDALYVFHVPLLFLASGYCAWLSIFGREEGAVSGLLFVRKKCRRILVPFLTWSLCGFALNLFPALYSGAFSVDFALQTAKRVFLLSGSVWYLWVLFLVSLIVYPVETRLKKPLIAHFVIWCVLIFVSNTTLFGLGFLPRSYLFFVVGFSFAKYRAAQPDADEKLRRLRPALFAMPAVFLGICLAARYPLRGFFFPADGEGLALNALSYALRLVWSFAGCLMVIAIIEGLFPKINALRRFFARVGLYSLDIYCIHMLLIRNFVVAPAEIMTRPVFAALYAFAYSLIAAFIICVISYFILRRFAVYRVLCLGLRGETKLSTTCA